MRVAAQRMSRKKPAPDLIRGGNRFSDKDMRKEISLASALPAVRGDRVQLQQLINGIQAMAGIDGRPRRLTIRSERDEAGEVRLSVEDSGNGIDPANANRLFDAFYTTKSGGMGLGLSICRSIAEAHGGRIWAVNHGGGGARFSFTLPDAARRGTAGAAHAVRMEL
jgi:signal transduction histidine kinase